MKRPKGDVSWQALPGTAFGPEQQAGGQAATGRSLADHTSPVSCAALIIASPCLLEARFATDIGIAALRYVMPNNEGAGLL